jgi:hypothetical protein
MLPRRESPAVCSPEERALPYAPPKREPCRMLPRRGSPAVCSPEEGALPYAPPALSSRLHSRSWHFGEQKTPLPLLAFEPRPILYQLSYPDRISGACSNSSMLCGNVNSEQSAGSLTWLRAVTLCSQSVLQHRAFRKLTHSTQHSPS